MVSDEEDMGFGAKRIGESFELASRRAPNNPHANRGK